MTLKTPVCAMLGIEVRGMPVPTFDGDPEDGPLWAGLTVDVVNEIKPAGEIVRDLVRETEAALRG